MTSVNITTQLFGSSHYAGSKSSMIKISTEFGKELFDNIRSEYLSNKDDLNWRQNIKSKYLEYERYLSDFINDDTMSKKYKMDDNDPEGWEIYNKLLDGYTIYKYFSEK